MTVNMHEAKTQFSKLAKLVESGEQVFVARNGKVIMKMVPLRAGERTAPGNFSVIRGTMGYISDEEWDKLDQEFLDSIEYGELLD
ncbi:MAG: type II toxin-antitoxin system Phd/YefM family antitoxin [Actinomycetota bacterium]|nr:type II toxin-antitoxin system Phd/YefM family antitoxin [Actinomycetota bacterium]MDA2985608.1 type II toxin-antitoxin system Phd/YefM family antitoxin [Actinomycetota bacterium]